MTLPPLETPIGTALRNDLKRDEGFRSYAYQDSLGYWTIGYGRNIDIRSGSISRREAELLLDNDMLEAITDLDERIPKWRDMPPDARRGLANMRFNLGWPRLAGFKKMLAALERGQFELAATEAISSRWATQVGNRATRIADLYRSCT